MQYVLVWSRCWYIKQNIYLVDIGLSCVYNVSRYLHFYTAYISEMLGAIFFVAFMNGYFFVLVAIGISSIGGEVYCEKGVCIASMQWGLSGVKNMAN